MLRCRRLGGIILMPCPFFPRRGSSWRCIPSSTMARTARLVVPGMPHHITQRGTRRFEFLLRIVAYCLMTNHVHYIAIPERSDSIRRVFHRVNGTHSKHFNIKYGLVGHLWQERPFSCVLDSAHFRTLLLVQCRGALPRC